MTARWIPGDDELDVVARSIDPVAPSTDHVEQMRSRLLGTQRTVRQQSGRSVAPWITGGAFAIAATVALVWWSRRADPSVAHAPKQVMESIGAARFESVTEWPDFVVRLDDGRMAFAISPLDPGERFRVKTADTELEVRGTRFVVQADNGRLVSVAVERGWIELRRPGAPKIDLRDGDVWPRLRTAVSGSGADPTPLTTPPKAPGTATPPPTSRTTTTTPSPTTPTPTPAHTTTPATPPTAPPTTTRTTTPVTPPTAPPTTPRTTTDVARGGAGVAPPTTTPRTTTGRPTTTPMTIVPNAPPLTPTPAGPGEGDFRAGMAALRTGKHADAAKLFAASCATAGDLGEDACFWAAASAKRAGVDPRTPLEQFLRRFPRSSRAGEASALLGWTLYDAGDLAGAEARFRTAVHDRVPQVRESAQRGLTAIERRRAKP